MNCNIPMLVIEGIIALATAALAGQWFFDRRWALTVRRFEIAELLHALYDLWRAQSYGQLNELEAETRGPKIVDELKRYLDTRGLTDEERAVLVTFLSRNSTYEFHQGVLAILAGPLDPIERARDLFRRKSKLAYPPDTGKL